MVLSYYIYKYPFKLFWHINNLLKLNREIVFYCADPLDYEMFIPIKKYLSKITIVAKNKKTKKYLSGIGVSYISLPVFPKVVIMARQSPYKFPVDQIIKIGFDHGLYQFKRWTSPKNYNGFDVYFVSSNEQVRIAKTMGITTTKAVGYPKNDNAFNGIYNEEFINKLKKEIKIDVDKKTIIFTSTWDVAGLSALNKWIDKIHTLTDDYNILVTVHTWTSPKLIEKLQSIKGVIYLDELNMTPYLMIADLFVGDYSSIIGEFCALDKPLITFKVASYDRSIPEVQELIKKISIQINNFNEIYDAIKISLKNPLDKTKERKEANEILFYKLDGEAGKRAAQEIIKCINKNLN